MTGSRKLTFKYSLLPKKCLHIHTVKDEKKSVKELTEIVGIDISTMSKHLDIPKKKKIIEGEKVKKFIYYQLALPSMLDFMSCAGKVINRK